MGTHQKQLADRLNIATALIAALAITLLFNPSHVQPQTPQNSIDPELIAKARAGDTEAQFQLGELYQAGRDVPQSYERAANWYRQAAEQGHEMAQLFLAALYDHGQGVTQDYAQAFLWYRKAAEQGNPIAQYNLGQHYSDGHGVPQDFAEAANWDRKAAEQGLAMAQEFLGISYRLGRGVPQDNMAAYIWLDIAAARMQKPDLDTVIKVRDVVAAELTPSELANAQKQAAEWFAAHPSKP